MATLVLTAVGTVLGGPLGGAIGAVLGNQLDNRLFAPRAARGARLSSLAVQDSTYGADLPRLFGTMRVAGTVIWSTDLQESTHHTGAKGQPKTTTYTYSASFAVALSARAILRVGRIWADGNLLRGADGDWKSDLGAFRLHLGDEQQAVDPLIAAAELQAPAHRGLAYAVLEDLQLADFGNRLPSLSFEVVADDGPVSLAAIAAALSDGDVGADAPGPLLDGYAAGGDSVRGALEGLGQSLPVAFATGPDGLVLVDERAAPLALDTADLGTAAPDKQAARVTVDVQAAGTLNEAVALSYADPARDWQSGSQTARRGSAGRRTGTVELPAAVSAEAARGFAEARLAREWAGRRQATVTLPPRALAIPAGAIVAVPGQGGAWRVTQRGYQAGVVTLTAVQLPGAGAPVPAASPGRAVTQPDLVQGPTRLRLLDLPSLGDAASDTPTLLVPAAGTGPGWRQATLLGTIDGGASWAPFGTTAAPAVLGNAATALPPGDPLLVDTLSVLEVELLHDGMTLAGDDRLGWSADSNLLAVGDELIQFGAAVQLSPTHWRLSRLLRGRRGTEWAVASHAPGDPVVLVDAATLAIWTLPAAARGAAVSVAATGLGDVTPAEATTTFQGRALLPPSPVALGATPLAGGGLLLGWTRRSRAGWTWLDGGDVPLAEESERYRVTLSAGARSMVVECTEPELTVTPAMLAALAPGPITADVVQLGTAGPSRAASLTLAGA